MRLARSLRQAAVAAGALLALAGSTAGPASAQLFWDWGGGSMVGGSGREVVRFNPKYAKGEVIVSFSDRRLYYITRPGEAISYPVASPREQSRWQGVTTVTMKRVNPPWTPTPEMMRENPRLPRWVPGGHPMNPLGVRALYLGSSAYRIHGTDAPWTIGTNVSKGCIRMYNQDVLDLYPRVNTGTKVTVTYDSFAGVASSGSSFAPSSAPSSSPSAGGSYSGGSFFDLFSFADEPPPKPRRKTVRPDKSASAGSAAKSVPAKSQPTPTKSAAAPSSDY